MLGMARAQGARSGGPLLARLLLGVHAAAPAAATPDFVCGDVAALPFAAGAFDLVWSNLTLQWVDDLPRALAELGRVLRVGGLVTFSTFGPDTLREIARGVRAASTATRTSAASPTCTTSATCWSARASRDPVMDMELFTLTYADAPAMLRDLKAIGATNATRARPRGADGPRPLASARWPRSRRRGATGAFRRRSR